MTIKIYRKREVFNSYVLDTTPEFTFENVTDLSIGKVWLRFRENGNPCEIRLDHTNYKYSVE